MIKEILKDLGSFSSPSRKKTNEWFFKTGPGDYGEGDVFLGVSVPDTRKVAKKYFKQITFKELEELLKNKIHEVRLLALEMLVLRYEEGEPENKKKCFRFYLKNIKYVNNWDLVDASAPYIAGDYLYNFNNKDISPLKKLAKSKNLWEKRVGIVACMYFIKNKSDKEIFEIAEIVKQDKHDLLQKALGWMLRESYKNVDEGKVRKFLKENIKTLPRTTLRYAIERMEKPERKMWLNLK